MPVRNFLIGLFEAGRPILNLGHTTFWWKPMGKDMKEESFTFCLLAFTPAGKLIYPPAEAALHWC